MKKIFTLLAVLLLLAAPLSSAWASGLYDQYGPMETWSDEQWQASEAWSDAEWDDYRQGEWEAYEQQYRELDRAHKLELGCPDPDGVNIKLNAAFLTFAEAKPELVDDGVYLPLRAVLAAAGVKATVNYDNTDGMVTVTLADGSKMAFRTGNETILYTSSAGEEVELGSYYPPLLLNGSMYVEEEDICRFLGWDSYWDYSYEILYVVDPEPLIGAINSEFKTINRLFTVNADFELGQSYQSAGSFGLSGTLYGEGKDDNISASFSYSGLQRGLDMDIDFAVTLDLAQMKDSVFSTLDEETWRILKTVGSGKGRIITNSAAGLMYVQSNLLPLLDKSLSATDWLKLEYPAAELADMLAGNMMQEALSSLNLGRLIYDSCRNNYYYGDQDVYARTLSTAGTWQTLLGDANFSQQSAGGYQVYTLSPDKQQQSIGGLSLPGSGGFPSLFGYGYGYADGERPLTINQQLRFREKDGQLHDVDYQASVNTTGIVPVSYKLALAGDQQHFAASLEIKGRYLGMLLFSAESTVKPVSGAPAAAPPAGSRVLDWQELNSSGIYRL